MIIYKITNKINNKIYIGLTTESLEKRWRTHKSSVGKKNHPLYNSMKKRGVCNFCIEQIDSADNIEKLGELERFYIQKYKSNNPKYGYNITAGGEHNQLDANPKAKLSMEDVINIRKLYKESKLNCKQAYELYKHKIKYGPFERCWEGRSWSSVMPEIYDDEEVRRKHLNMRVMPGDLNINAKYTKEEIIEMRLFYMDHTFAETYEKYGKDISKTGLNGVLRRKYLNIGYLKDKKYDRMGKPRGPYKKHNNTSL